MSCYLVSEKRIKQLAEYLNDLKKYGFNTFGYSIPTSLDIELENNVKDIYDQLATLNLNAVNYRYKQNYSLLDYEYVDDVDILWKQNDYSEGHYIIKQWHYDLYKALQHFVYQCDEDGNYNNDLLKALYDLEHLIAAFIVANQPEYVKAIWS